MTTPSFHYRDDDILRSLRAAGVEEGDTVLVYVSLGRLGYSERGRTMAAACDAMASGLRMAVGPEGTLVVPTYTYSIGRREVFDVASSPSTIGEFTEFMRLQPDAVRSADPMLAVTAIGPQAASLVHDLPRTCFGDGCVYARLDAVDAKICMVGLDLHWATYRHYVEAMANVPFRFAKQFDGVVRDARGERHERWTYHAAPRQPNCAPDGASLAARVKERGISRTTLLGRGSVTVIKARDYHAAVRDELRRDPWCAAKGPPASARDLEQLEDDRVGATKLDIPLPTRSTPSELVQAFTLVPRGELSRGSDALARALVARGWICHEIPSGAPAGAEVVPEKWVAHVGTIESEAGERLFSLESHPHLVVPGSLTFNGVVTRDELEARLRPSVLGRGASPPRRAAHHDWELALAPDEQARLRDSRYRIEVRTELGFGTLKVLERAPALDSRAAPILFCAETGGVDLEAVAAVLEAFPPSEPADATRVVVGPSLNGIAAWLPGASPAARAVIVVSTASDDTSPLVAASATPDIWTTLASRAARTAQVDARVTALPSLAGVPAIRVQLPLVDSASVLCKLAAALHPMVLQEGSHEHT